jgi:hypothetical protein
MKSRGINKGPQGRGWIGSQRADDGWVLIWIKPGSAASPIGWKPQGVSAKAALSAYARMW